MNIKEVAEKADVSVATISRVLNGSDKVTSKTKERVEKIINELGYFPNANAKNLREDKSGIILICVPDIENMIYSKITKGILTYLAKNSYKGMIHICYDNETGKKTNVREYEYMFKTKKIDGIIFLSSSISEKNYLKLAKEYNVITCSEYFDNDDIETIGVDQYEIMKSLLDYLFDEKKIKVPYYYTWETMTGTTRNRVKSYIDYLENKGIIDFEKYYKNINFEDLKKIEKQIESDIKDNPKIDAIIINSDFYAIFIKRILRKMNKDIIVTSFDGTRLLDIIFENIIYIQQPFEEMGEISAALLLKKIEKKNYEKKVYLEYELIDKDREQKQND